MDSLTLEQFSSPTFWASLTASIATLCAIRVADAKAARYEQKTDWDHRLGRYVPRFATRIRIEMTPVLAFGEPMTARLFHPKFLLSEILCREPMAIAPMSVAWFCWLFHEPVFAAKAAGVGIIWRIIYDLWFGLSPLPLPLRMRTLGLKILFICGVGIWVASMVYLTLLLIMFGLVLLTFLAAGGSSKRRRY